MYYFYHAIGLAAVFLILDILDSLFVQNEWRYFNFFPESSETVNVILTLGSEFIIGVIVFFAIGFAWNELSLLKYKRKLEELEDER